MFLFTATRVRRRARDGVTKVRGPVAVFRLAKYVGDLLFATSNCWASSTFGRGKQVLNSRVKELGGGDHT